MRESRCGTVESLRPQVETHERVLVAEIQKAVGERGERPHCGWKDLRASKRTKGLRLPLTNDQLTVPTNNHHPVAPDLDPTATESILTPTHLCRLHLDA